MSEATSLRRILHFPEGGTYKQFIEQHLLKNEPCIFGEWATKDWGARTHWVRGDGSPNFTYLAREFGISQVSVANCTQCKFSTHPKTEMALEEYLTYWQAHLSQCDDNTVSECDDNTDVTSATQWSSHQKLYLKDWHFVKEFPEHGAVAYTPHPFLRSDWLNEVWSAREDVDDDYKFVYMGPRGTWTPFHADVLRSYSWSANVTGSKEWLLFPPGEENLLRDKLGNLPFDLRSDEWKGKMGCGSVPSPIRVIQQAGEIIFVPSGWHHQVCNLEDTISINHNWNNAFCLQNMWNHLQHELQLVRRELQDCVGMEGWHQQCQVILKASAGMDYFEFAQFIVALALPRLHSIERIETCGDYSWTTLKQFIHKVISNGDQQRGATFFKDGSFPADFNQRALPDTSVLNSLDLQTSLKDFIAVFTPEVKSCMEQVSCNSSSSVLYHVFELHKLSFVAKELDRALCNAHTF